MTFCYKCPWMDESKKDKDDIIFSKMNICPVCRGYEIEV